MGAPARALARTLLAVLLVLALLSEAAAKGNYAKGRAKRYSKPGGRMDSLDKEMALRRTSCEASTREQGGPCMSSAIEMENCVMRCVSPACYDRIYGDDALEEGEIDTLRGRSYRTCIRADIRNAQLRERSAPR